MIQSITLIFSIVSIILIVVLNHLFEKKSKEITVDELGAFQRSKIGKNEKTTFMNNAKLMISPDPSPPSSSATPAPGEEEEDEEEEEKEPVGEEAPPFEGSRKYLRTDYQQTVESVSENHKKEKSLSQESRESPHNNGVREAAIEDLEGIEEIKTPYDLFSDSSSPQYPPSSATAKEQSRTRETDRIYKTEEKSRKKNFSSSSPPEEKTLEEQEVDYDAIFTELGVDDILTDIQEVAEMKEIFEEQNITDPADIYQQLEQIRQQKQDLQHHHSGPAIATEQPSSSSVDEGETGRYPKKEETTERGSVEAPSPKDLEFTANSFYEQASDILNEIDIPSLEGLYDTKDVGSQRTLSEPDKEQPADNSGMPHQLTSPNIELWRKMLDKGFPRK